MAWSKGGGKASGPRLNSPRGRTHNGGPRTDPTAKSRPVKAIKLPAMPKESPDRDNPTKEQDYNPFKRPNP
jgi:hypothetical protein